MKCFLCNKKGEMRHELKICEVCCDYHFEVLKRAEEKSSVVVAGMRITAESKRKIHLSNFDRRETRKKTAKLIEKGEIQKTPCEVCGETKTQVHHYDYLDPLNVAFLCEKHHREWHKENK